MDDDDDDGDDDGERAGNVARVDDGIADPATGSFSGDRYGVVSTSDTSTLSRRADPLQRRRGS